MRKNFNEFGQNKSTPRVENSGKSGKYNPFFYSYATPVYSEKDA